MKSQTIFLTGATGLVGSQLTEALSQHSFRVKALSRNKQLQVKGVEWIVSDILSSDLMLCKQLEGADVIIHNAACLKAGNTTAELEEIQKVNVDFTERLLNCAVQVNIKKIIFTSGFNLVKKPLPDLISETAALNPTTPYAKSKYIGEQLMQEYAAKYALNMNILRLSSPVNLNVHLLPETVVKRWILQSVNNQTIQIHGNGNRTQDFVAVSDIANAFLSCIEYENVNGIFNIASGNTISMIQLAELITKKYGNNYIFTGIDENENDRWNISIEKANKLLQYKPEFSSLSIISELIKKSAS